MSERGFFDGRGGLLAVAVVMFALGAGTARVFLAQKRDSAPETAPSATKPEKQTAPVVVPSTFEAFVRPLLDAKCSACHGETKQKAGLSFATQEKILAGGRHGPVIDRATPQSSLMLTRIALALDEDKHMPPDDHDQLAPEELAGLQRWILAGAPFEGVVQGIANAANAPVAVIASKPATTTSAQFADPATLAALRAALVHVQPVSEGSPLLWVDFAAAAKSFDDAKVSALLTPLRVQLCELSLARSQVGDPTMTMLAEFADLRRLDLRATAISDLGVAALAKHTKLAELVLSQNKLTDACVDSLIAMPGLLRIHLWRSGISAEGVARLRESRPKLHVDDGADAASVALDAETTIALTKAPPPVTAQETSVAAASLVPINMKCPVTGSPVKPKYTIVFEGKVIGFCCPDCPKEFWADPAKYADKLQ